jgi:hypothetical protein
MSFTPTQAKSPDATPPGKGHKSQDPVDILVFLIPCLQFVHVMFIGALSGSDLLLLGTFVYLAFRQKLRITASEGKWLLFFGSLWLVSQCVTDIVRHSDFADYARGWSNIGMTLVGFAVLYTLLYERPRRLLLFGWGLVAGNVLLYFINPSNAMLGGAGNAWKFAFAYSVTLGVFLIASSEQCRGHWPVTLSVMIGIINMVQGARSVGGICLAVSLYLVVTRFSRRKGEGVSRFKTGTVIVLAALIILGVTGILWSYGYAASAGILGEDARQKYEEQSSGKYGVLLGGRTELLASIPAIFDSPILGHGSWARDPIYLIEQHRALAALGYEGAKFIDPAEIVEGQIPAHSYLFGAWVDAGLLGAVFWGWVFVLTARGLMRVYPAAAVLLPVMSFMAFSLLWNILFSPYGTLDRITFPYVIVMLMTCMGTAPGKAVRAAATPARRMPRSKPKRVA